MSVSTYYQSLDQVSQQRYKEKISLIDEKDPYLIENDKWTMDVALFPPVTYPYVFAYPIHTESPCTMEDLKSNKNLDAYNHVTSGWVRDVKIHAEITCGYPTAQRSTLQMFLYYPCLT